VICVYVCCLASARALQMPPSMAAEHNVYLNKYLLVNQVRPQLICLLSTY